MTNLIWVNAERTVMVQKYGKDETLYVATRSDPGYTWGPPMACSPDLDTALHLRAERCLDPRSEEHTSELQSLRHLVCRLLLEKKKKPKTTIKYKQNKKKKTQKHI